MARTGEQTPGAAPGTSFAEFGSPMFDGAPTIGVDSSTAFACFLSDGTTGFWVDHGSGGQLIARSGSAAPGAGAGALFSQRLAEITVVTPPLLAPGHVVLQDTIRGPGIGFANDEGIWHADDSGLTLLMREGTAAPVLANIRIGHLRLRALDAAGRAIISTSLTGNVVPGNDEAIWRTRPDGTSELLAREGDAAPGAGFGVVFATAIASPAAFPFVIGNAGGSVLFASGLHGPGTDAGNDEGLFLRDSSGTRLLVRKGDAVPGMSGFVVDGTAGSLHAIGISLAPDDRVAMSLGVTDGSNTATVLLAESAGVLAPRVRTGDPAPGSGTRFEILGSPHRNVRGEVAFLASTTIGAARPPMGLWISTAMGLRAAALPGLPLAGAPPGTVIQDIRTISAFHDDGFLLFLAQVGDVGGATSDTALLIADPAGAITVLARTGESLQVADTGLRTVSRIGVRPGALSADVHAAFTVGFTDGSSAEILASLDVQHVRPGTAGKGSLVPALAVALPDGVTGGAIEVTRATGRAHGLLGLLPADPRQPDRFATIALGCGSALWGANLLLVEHVLSGSPGVPGDGSALFPIGPLPPGILGTTWYLQAGYVDLEAPCGALALSDILRVRIH